MNNGRQQRLLLVATQAGLDALTEELFCFGCGASFDDHEMGMCETCEEVFCESCRIEPQQAMEPDCCHACAGMARDVDVTNDSLQRQD